MSVYIRGMEMPTRCGRCDMCVTIPDGDIDRHNECCITGADILDVGEKMEDCPIIPVPDHGRLIGSEFERLVLENQFDIMETLVAIAGACCGEFGRTKVNSIATGMMRDVQKMLDDDCLQKARIIMHRDKEGEA